MKNNRDKLSIIFTSTCVIVTTEDHSDVFRLNTPIVNYRGLRDIVAKIIEKKDYEKELKQFNKGSSVGVIDVLEYIYSAIVGIDYKFKEDLNRYLIILETISNRPEYIRFSYDLSFSAKLIEGIKTVANVYY